VLRHARVHDRARPRRCPGRVRPIKTDGVHSQAKIISIFFLSRSYDPIFIYRPRGNQTMPRHSWIEVNNTKLSTVIERHFDQPGSMTCAPRAINPGKTDCWHDTYDPPLKRVRFNNLSAAEISPSIFSDVAFISNGTTFIRTKKGVTCKIDANDRLHCHA